MNPLFSSFIDTVNDAGLTNPYGLAAVAATGQAESGFSPYNANRVWNDGANDAGGIMSWNGPRLAALQRFAASKGETGNGSPQTQAEFFAQENPGLIDKLQSAKSVDQAQSLMNDAWRFKGYDQPGNKDAAHRLDLARNFATSFANGSTPSVPTPSDPPADQGTQPMAKSSAIANPVLDPTTTAATAKPSWLQSDQFGNILSALGASLLTSPGTAPLSGFPAALERQQKNTNALAEQSALAQALIEAGIPPAEAKQLAINPVAAKVALDTLKTKQAKALNTAFLGKIAGLDAPDTLDGTTPAAVAAPAKPSASSLLTPLPMPGTGTPSASPAPTISTPPAVSTPPIQAASPTGPRLTAPVMPVQKAPLPLLPSAPPQAAPINALPGGPSQSQIQSRIDSAFADTPSGTDPRSTASIAPTLPNAPAPNAGATASNLNALLYPGPMTDMPAAAMAEIPGAPMQPKTSLAPQASPPVLPASPMRTSAVQLPKPLPALPMTGDTASGASSGAVPAAPVQAPQPTGNKTFDYYAKRGQKIAQALMAAPSKEALDAGKVLLSQNNAMMERFAPTATMKEYNAAVSQGYQGSLQDWILMGKDSTYRTLGPDEVQKLGLPPGSYQQQPNGRITKIGNGINISIGGTPVDDLPTVPLDQNGVPDKAAQAAFLAKLPSSTAALVKGIASYQLPIDKVTSLRGNERQQLAQVMAQYDPTFDMSQYPVRLKMRQSITSGPYSQALNSANLVIQHLDAVQSAADSLGNTNYPLLNRGENFIKYETGNPAISRFNTAADAAASELAKVFKGSGAPAEQEIKDWRNNLSINSSPDQIKASIGTAIGQLLKSRIDTIRQQYQAAMGKPANFSFLSAHSANVLQDLGIDPTTIDPNAGINAVGGAPEAPSRTSSSPVIINGYRIEKVQ